MGGALSKVYIGCKGTVKGENRKVKGIRNKRSQTSPKALLAIKQKRLKMEQAKAAAKRY